MALLGNIIAVVPDSYTPGQPPGGISTDGGATWAPMGALPDPPRRGKLVPVLSAEAAEGSLVLDLMSGTTASGGATVARYVSRDGGRTWSADRCAALPTAGCAAADLWAQTPNAQYVLYHRRLFRNEGGRGWQPMAATTPVSAGSIEQVVAAARGQSDVLYLVTRAAVWRLDPDGTWASITEHLPLLAPSPPAYTSLPPGWPAAT
jgi:hypothetical protein